jgi:hypothetical protein
MLKTLRNRLSKLESQKPAGEYRYQLNTVIIVDDSKSDEYLHARQKAEPHKRFIRFGDFADECC